MTVTLLLIRHGSHGDVGQRLSGRLPDRPLTAAGRGEAAALARHLAREPIARVECSPLDRTRETAALVAAAHALPAPTPVDALLELDMGRWTGARFADLADDPEWDRWNTARGTARIPGGETVADVLARMLPHLHALATHEAGRTIALVTHADVVRAVVAHALGLPLDNLLRFDIDPASVTRLLWGNWGARLLSLNERAAPPADQDPPS